VTEAILSDRFYPSTVDRLDSDADDNVHVTGQHSNSPNKARIRRKGRKLRKKFERNLDAIDGGRVVEKEIVRY
jgi:hypothetical protein